MLISLGASLKMIDNDGEKTIPLESIYTGNGVYPRDIPKLAIITGIMIRHQSLNTNISEN